VDTIGIFEAKTRFSEIIERVHATGQGVTVTNRGKPVVDIVPTRTDAPRKLSRAEAFDDLARVWDECPAGKPGEVRSLIDEGREP
jgi:prevent-host-death family protein